MKGGKETFIMVAAALEWGKFVHQTRENIHGGSNCSSCLYTWNFRAQRSRNPFQIDRLSVPPSLTFTVGL